MREMIKMVVVLTVLSALSGGLLASVRNGTLERIEYQQLKFVKGPAIRSIMEGSSNDPITDRFKLTDEKADTERSFFVGKFNGEPKAVAFETYGKGYGGDIGVMVGINLETGELVGIGVTTHAETPGVGARAKTEPSFAEQFRGMPVKDKFAVKDDGGDVDALSGATITSRGVAVALTKASEVYGRMKDDLKDKLKEFK
jgi:electron transport complex protein RnfG